MDYVPDIFERENVWTIRVGSKVHLVFASTRQLDILRKSKTWYLDGTFKLVKEPFVQLYSIHSFVKKDTLTKQVPSAQYRGLWQNISGFETKIRNFAGETVRYGF
jgi:hypothetical protein